MLALKPNKNHSNKISKLKDFEWQNTNNIQIAQNEKRRLKYQKTLRIRTILKSRCLVCEYATFLVGTSGNYATKWTTTKANAKHVLEAKIWFDLWC